MPTVSVSVRHSHDPADVKVRAEPHIEKMVDDFEGHDLELEWTENKGEFSFKSMAFTINGDIEIDAEQITVNVDLPTPDPANSPTRCPCTIGKSVLNTVIPVSSRAPKGRRSAANGGAARRGRA